MAEMIQSRSVKLISSFVYKDEAMLSKALKAFSGIYGPVDELSKDMDFDLTDYYDKEFGTPLRRKLVSFEKLIELEGIGDSKIRSNGIEDSHKENNRRTVNIDPGYITEAKLVLLTTKDYTHRIHVKNNIFAECTLFFQDGEFRRWPWTYPDYASDELREYFGAVREMYIKQLRGSSLRHS